MWYYVNDIKCWQIKIVTNYYCYWKIVDKSHRVDENFSINDKCESKNFYKRFVINNKKSKKSLFVILVQWKVFYKRKIIIKKWNKQWKKNQLKIEKQWNNLFSSKFEKHVVNNFINSMKTRFWKTRWWRNRDFNEWRNKEKLSSIVNERWYREITKINYRFEKQKSWYETNAKVNDMIKCFNTTTTNYDREKKLQKIFCERTNKQKLIKIKKF